MGPTALLPLQRKTLCGFSLPLKIHHLSWVLTCEPWSQWQGPNYYTIEVTSHVPCENIQKWYFISILNCNIADTYLH
jgi:hypothetical protein